ncbi:hypothetical protein BC938DRAFT_472548 [Jimgerdemannia flammicorona]|uniref:Uncharacterized protein n=1 Tax=Jimgerdemannia flammicorona TaxID=994334 RepID=A0A433Q5V7_9FUNG|nr:hypothetical protein BC938DRAFT_472548 [Jimgerdemannia flammicorona]
MKSYWPSVSSLSTPCTTNRALWRDDKHNSYPLNIGYTIAKLAATKAHRVWCIDERSKAVGYPAYRGKGIGHQRQQPL